MESVYHIVAIRVNETSWAHVWKLHFCYLGTGYDILSPQEGDSGAIFIGKVHNASPSLQTALEDSSN
jgi:hypothetical protein